MKKLLTILLALSLVFGLLACSGGNAGGEGNKGAAGLKVGFGRVNMTPNYSVPLAGYGNTSMRMSQGFIDYIYATCIAITDANDSTLLLITLDMTGMYNNIAPQVQESINKATGIPVERIMMNVTHTHSGPDLTNTKEPNIQKYTPEFIQYVTQAAVEALADRSPATMETAKGYTEGLNFVRHYITTTGQLLSDNMSQKGEIVEHHHEPDNEIQLIVFRRAAEDKKDIVAMNWQSHIKMDSTSDTPEGQQGRPMISPDGVGTFRKYVEENGDYLLAFYLGAAGNLNTWSRIASENKTPKAKEWGTLMGEAIMETLKTTTPVEGTVIKEAHYDYEAYVDKTEDSHVLEARKVSEVWKATNNFSSAVAADSTGYIVSPYHADSIISRANASAAARILTINTFSIGDIGIATAPYEMFDVNGKFVKDNSPYDTTFIMSMCNGANAYIAADYAFEDKGTYEVHNRTFPRGTAEGVADKLVEMLKGL